MILQSNNIDGSKSYAFAVDGEDGIFEASWEDSPEQAREAARGFLKIITETLAKEEG